MSPCDDALWAGRTTGLNQPDTFPAVGQAARQALLRHNAIWQKKWQGWLKYAVAGSTSAHPSPELRMNLDGYLPWVDFVCSLNQLGRVFLPGLDWLPAVLAQDQPHLQRRCCGALAGLPDFWQNLPKPLSGKVCFAANELLPLFCQLADPLRNGTARDRYPQQQRHWLEIVSRRSDGRTAASLLDLGCGVGLGTGALLQRLRERVGEEAQADGVSAERLEIWMASAHRLPHAPWRENEFAGFGSSLGPGFYHGTAESFLLPRRYDYIFCNGLIGGGWLRSAARYAAVLQQIKRHLLSSGSVFVANRFHAGCQRDCQAFLRQAAATGWQVQGDWNDAVLRLPL